LNKKYNSTSVFSDTSSSTTKANRNRRTPPQTRRQDQEGTESRWQMKHLLLTTIAAVVLVGCGESQQSTPQAEANPAERCAEIR